MLLYKESTMPQECEFCMLVAQQVVTLVSVTVEPPA